MSSDEIMFCAARDRNEVMGELFQFASVVHVLLGKTCGLKRGCIS